MFGRTAMAGLTSRWGARWARVNHKKKITILRTELPPHFRTEARVADPPKKLDMEGNHTFDVQAVMDAYEITRANDLLTADNHLEFLSVLMSLSTPDDSRPVDAIQRLLQRSGQPPGVEELTILIQAFARTGRLVDAQATFKQIVDGGHAPTQQTYGAMLRACSAVDEKTLARGYWDEMVAKQLVDDALSFDDVYTGFRRLGL
eukprot:TRINITY_DN6037_c0_g1_i1.p1 TRINITY_DN6037_c0_g1~~TRINITY_DN6037_c0_g1_i1.p1  ORF type:complete len:213 (-),score=30.08 TRINITY_DN6037_c0_g1_i1:4-612(-)